MFRQNYSPAFQLNSLILLYHIYFCSKQNSEYVIYLDGIAALSTLDRDLLDISMENLDEIILIYEKIAQV
ncbi:MAG: hypothetical protein H6Q68_1603 [Firmicutes bacterium]|nr:hypothetical protein [Bacillota bacterium]